MLTARTPDSQRVQDFLLASSLVHSGPLWVGEEAPSTCWIEVTMAHDKDSVLVAAPIADADDPGPSPEDLGPGGSILRSEHLMTAEVEEVADPIVGGEEASRLPG